MVPEQAQRERSGEDHHIAGDLQIEKAMSRWRGSKWAASDEMAGQMLC